MCSKSKFPTTHHHHQHYHRRRRRHNHHHHLLLQLLLKAFVVARVNFKQRNPGAAEDGAGDVYLAYRHLPAQNPSQTHVAEDVFGAAKGGVVKVLVVKSCPSSSAS